jgi:MFS family permease
MAPWFSASAVAPALVTAWSLSPATAPWLTITVQLGFVAGALTSSILVLSDRWSARRLIAGSAVIAAAATVGVAFAPNAATGIVLRVATGAALAGVYPPGMKLAAGWFRSGRGTAIGIMVGALTLGSAGPHLVRWEVPASAWRLVLGVAAASALLGAVIVSCIPGEGPYAAPAAPFSWAAVPRIVRDRAITFANVGYLGHMWELYAMWSWVLAFWTAAVVARGAAPAIPALMAFAALAAGAIGCVIGGWAADRIGRTALTIAAMLVSASCALVIGAASGGPLWLLAAITLLWGVSIVADSAQFSTCVTELVPPEYAGTALTLQTALGFLLTIVSIRCVPLWVARWGWSYAFMPLAAGPLLGSLAMWRLRRLPEAKRLASGAR